MLTLTKFNKINFRNLNKLASNIKGFSKTSCATGDVKYADKFYVKFNNYNT